MKLVFSSDHAGYTLRGLLVEHARASGHETIVVGAPSEDAFDYPDAADDGCEVLLNGEADFAVLICGTGVGICMRANKHQGIRAASCTSVKLAKMARQHNHANVLCLGQRITEPDVAQEIMQAFLSETQDTAERHSRRVAKIDGNATVRK